MAAMDQAIPIPEHNPNILENISFRKNKEKKQFLPRNTLTALEPVTLPTEASAQSSSMAATLEAKVSRGRSLLEI
jgi:hypothetical protein